jgi:aminoglycoside 3-N-acetyltransferase
LEDEFMREQKVIKATARMNTVDTLYNDLRKLGVNDGDILLVHSSLSSLGWVCGAAQAVIMALFKAVGEQGTLVMPSHSGDISDPAEWENPPVPAEWVQSIYENMPAFDPHLTPSRGMGRIAELFRTLPQVVRSSHPQLSFSAWGRSSVQITEDHPLTPSLGMGSPLGRIYALNGKVLLLGAGFDSCTSFHLSEALNEKMPLKKMGTALMEGGKRVWKWFEDYDYNSDEDFEKIGEAFENTGKVLSGKVGSADSRLFSIR